MELTVAKALRVKNRLAEQRKQLVKDLIKWNSTRLGTTVPVDLSKTWEKLLSITDALIALKSELSIVSAQVQDKIHKIAELKCFISDIKNIPTFHGTIVSEDYDRFNRVNVVQSAECAAHLKLDFITAKIKQAENTIDALTEELELFNATTKIKVAELDKVM